MKNTMKIKSLLSFCVPAALLSLSMASCSDYDNGYTEGAIKFTEDFRKTFGDIDPEQDWNLAERAYVTVSTTRESDVKIYALMGDEYCIVGHYKGVKDRQVLGFDMVEGTKSIMVTDGVTAEQTVPGGEVAFGSTRTVLSSSDNKVTLTKLTNEVTINEEKYPAYKYYNSSTLQRIFEKVPQGQYNIDNVTCDFTFVSTGSFIIYPSYWYTISNNTLGLYYYDNNGIKHDVDIYRMHDGSSGELWCAQNASYETFTSGGGQKQTSANGWTLSNMSGSFSDANTWNFRVCGDRWDDESEMTGNFMEYWRSTPLGNATISKTFTVSNDHEYIVAVKVRLRGALSSTNNPGSLTFSANGSSVELTNSGNCQKSLAGDQGLLYSDMDATKTIWVKCQANNNTINVNLQLNGVAANWLCFNDLKFVDISNAAGDNEHMFGVNNEHLSTGFAMGQGIKVDLAPGTRFGMYLRKTDDSYKFYSESEWNKKDSRLVGTSPRYHFDCPLNYGSTFYVGDQMYLGFEDWPGPDAASGGGDFDLNDMVFAFEGCKPIIINEDPEPSSWLLACEDLGSTFDIDYNDVVFKIQHVSGETKAYLTPLAAGGTLASYIYFEDPIGNNDKVFNEIHQLFGAEPQNSGDYTIINALNSRTEKTCAPIEFTVDPDWTLAFYSTDSYHQGDQYQNVNMGGLEIRTLPKNTPAPSSIPRVNDNIFSGASRIQAPNELGAAPYILCIPASYTRLNMNGYTPEAGKKTEYEWAWPVEYCNITAPYPEFAEWVSNHNAHGDWYKNKNTSGATVEDKYVVSYMNGGLQASDLAQTNASTKLKYGNTNVNLRNYFTTSSTGTVHYTITSTTNSAQTQTVDKNYNEDYSFNFTDGGAYITITQDANGSYSAGSIQFEIIAQKQSNLTAQNTTKTKGEVIQLSNYISTSSNGAISYGSEYHFVANDPTFPSYYNSDANYDANFDKTNGTLTPEYAGTYTFTVTQAETDEYEGRTATLTITVTAAGNGGNNGNGVNYNGGYLENEKKDNYSLSITKNADGTFNVSYNGNPLKNNATAFTIKWSGNSVQYDVNQAPVTPSLVIQQDNASASTNASETGSYTVNIATFNQSNNNPSGFSIRSASGVPFYLEIE